MLEIGIPIIQDRGRSGTDVSCRITCTGKDSLARGIRWGCSDTCDVHQGMLAVQEMQEEEEGIERWRSQARGCPIREKSGWLTQKGDAQHATVTLTLPCSRDSRHPGYLVASTFINRDTLYYFRVRDPNVVDRIEVFRRDR